MKQRHKSLGALITLLALAAVAAVATAGDAAPKPPNDYAQIAVDCYGAENDCIGEALATVIAECPTEDCKQTRFNVSIVKFTSV